MHKILQEIGNFLSFLKRSISCVYSIDCMESLPSRNIHKIKGKF